MEQNEEERKFRIHFVGYREAFRDPKLMPSSKAVLGNLIGYAGVNGKCFPSQETLAHDMGLSPRQIRNILKELKDRGYISWESGEKGKSNKYKFSEEIYFRIGDAIGKPTSQSVGNIMPPTVGNTLPTKVITESNQESSQSQLQQLFAKIAKRQISSLEAKQLFEMQSKHPKGWIEDAIREAGKRNYPVIELGLVGLILQDWHKTGKPEPKPIFKPCGINGCDGGYIFTNIKDGAVKVCICKTTYDQVLKKWREQWSTITHH
jgi:DNA-binding Lrp family transcriptional regulator